MTSQNVGNKTLELKISSDSKFNQVIGTEEDGKLKLQTIGLKDLKIGDRVYFYARPVKDGIPILLSLNVKSK